MPVKGCVWKLCFSVFFSVNFATTAILRNNDLFRLDLVHYNDFHDRFEETSLLYPICTTNDTSCLGGFPRLYQEIHTLLREKPDALLLNAGDTFQGTYWYTLLKWSVTQHFINMLPNDAHTIGNHEFDGGVEGLAPYLAALRAPVLVANIDTSEEPSLNGLYKPHIVIEKKGKKIGIIGLITVETKLSSKPTKVIFLDPIKAALKEANLLTKEGVDIIIILSHCGLDVDKEIARVAGENIDIIVGGHSHSLLWNGDAPSREKVSGPYPVMVDADAKPGHKVLVVTASAYTKYLGNMTAYFDSEGELVSHVGEPVFLNRSIPEDPEIKALMKPYSEKLYEMVNKLVGHTTDNLLEMPCGSGECALGDLIADAYLDATKEANPSNLTAVAFLMRNMIRGSISEGDITRGAIINIMPFSNTLSTFSIPGRYLVEALERCLSKSWREDPFTGPWMPQVAGMQLTVNTTSRKVDSVLVKSGEAFQPLQLDQVYQVTIPDFIAIGGNGFKMFEDHGRDLKNLGVDYEIFEAYIQKVSPVTNTLDHRLIIVK